MFSNNCDIHQKPRIVVCLYNSCPKPFLCMSCLKEHDDTHNENLYDRLSFDKEKQEIIEKYESGSIFISENKEKAFSKNKILMEESLQAIEGAFKKIKTELKKKKNICMEDLGKIFELPPSFKVEDSILGEGELKEFKETCLTEEKMNFLTMKVLSLRNDLKEMENITSSEYFESRKINLEFVNKFQGNVLTSIDEISINGMFSKESPQKMIQNSEKDFRQELLIEENKAMKSEIKELLETIEKLQKKNSFSKFDAYKNKDSLNDALSLENKKLKEKIKDQEETITLLKARVDEATESKSKQGQFYENLQKNKLNSNKFLEDSILLSQDDIKWLSTTCFLNKKMKSKLIFRASRDGYEAENFHNYCNECSPTLVIAQTNFNKIIGGYTTEKWKGGSRILYSKDSLGKSFLFSVSLKEKYPIKNTDYAICNTDGSGPKFGGGYDLEIVDNCNTQYNTSTDIGHSYLTNRNKEEFYGGAKYLISDYEVYVILGD